MTTPQDGHYADITRSETPGKPVTHYGVSITIATQYLKIPRRKFYSSDLVQDFAFKRALHTPDTVWTTETAQFWLKSFRSLGNHFFEQRKAGGSKSFSLLTL